MRFSLLLITGALAISMAKGPKRSVTEAEAKKVHAAAIVFDTHNDYPMNTIDGVDFTLRRTEGHTDFPRMKEGGMTAQIFAAYVAPTYVQGNRSAHRALEGIDSIKRDIVGKTAKDTFFATSAADVLRAKKSGKMAIMVGIEGGHAIQDSLRLLRDFYDLGVRYMTLTHTNTNGWADSEGDMNNPAVKHHNGLTPFGKEVIAEMNKLGMMVDVAHVADKTFWDVLEVSKAPIFSSHSSCRALANVTRNMTDEMIVALAKKGGQININFSCDFLSQKSADTSPMRNPELRKKFMDLMSSVSDPNERRNKMKDMMASMPKMERAKLSDVVAHINHVVNLVGVDRVGIGSDYDGIGCTPEGLDDTSKWLNLTRALLEEGYTADEVHKILGGNMVRFMQSVEVAAKRP
jgi:membrane dipeptidase